jgi:hypothetical protein
VHLARERGERPAFGGAFVQQRQDAGERRIAQRRQPRGRTVRRGRDPAADRGDEEQVDQARDGDARAGLRRTELSRQQLDERRDVAPADRIGRHVHDGRQQAHQRLGRVGVVAVGGADEGRRRPRAAEASSPAGVICSSFMRRSNGRQRPRGSEERRCVRPAGSRSRSPGMSCSGGSSPTRSHAVPAVTA